MGSQRDAAGLRRCRGECVVCSLTHPHPHTYSLTHTPTHTHILTHTHPSTHTQEDEPSTPRVTKRKRLQELEVDDDTVPTDGRDVLIPSGPKTKDGTYKQHTPLKTASAKLLKDKADVFHKQATRAKKQLNAIYDRTNKHRKEKVNCC